MKIKKIFIFIMISSLLQSNALINSEYFKKENAKKLNLDAAKKLSEYLYNNNFELIRKHGVDYNITQLKKLFTLTDEIEQKLDLTKEEKQTMSRIKLESELTAFFTYEEKYSELLNQYKKKKFKLESLQQESNTLLTLVSNLRSRIASNNDVFLTEKINNLYKEISSLEVTIKNDRYDNYKNSLLKIQRWLGLYKTFDQWLTQPK